MPPEAEVTIDLIVELAERYQKDPNLQPAWNAEKEPVQRLIEKVEGEIEFNYTIETVLGVGGSGIVLKARDHNLNAPRALKIARPSPGKEKLLAHVLIKETENLKRLSHPNLIRIFAQGLISEDDSEFPYYIMDFVEGVKDADDYLRGAGLTERGVIGIFRDVLAAISYIHSQDTIHLDIKPGNVLVSPSGTAILSDLGFAKHLTDEHGSTMIGGTEGFIHPDARKFVRKASSDENRRRGRVPDRSLLNPIWDCYSLGKTFLRLLEELDEHNPKILSAYTHRYLRLLACRLLDGHNTGTELALGLSLTTMSQIKYEGVEQAVIDVEKLSGEYNLETRIPELNPFVESTIQACKSAVTAFTPRVRALLQDPSLATLGTISQLGLLNLVYPAATHTRLEHSLGTFSITARYIAALYYDPLNPLFRQIMDEEDLRAVLISALVHDIGQYPLAHDLEEADKKVFSHNRRGLAILQGEDRSIAAVIEDEEQWNVPVSRVVNILEAQPQELAGELKDRVLHSLIDGPIDADKIDYLVRDSQNLGVEYGEGLSFERLLRTLTVVSRTDGTDTYAALGIHEKGKVPAEGVAFARYALYGQVYWQHTYRAIKAKLQRMAWEMLEREGGPQATGYEKKVRDQLHEYLDTTTVTAPQEELFPPQAAWPHGGQIQAADHAMLYWLSRRSGPAGEQLYGHIRDRRLFKRILVVSRAKNESMWNNVFALYRHDRQRGAWTQKLRFQREFQDAVRALIEGAAPPENPSVVITDDARNRFLADAADKVVLLADFPVEQSAKDAVLEYVVEEDRLRSKGNDMQTGTLEESIVWKELRQNFHRSLGKLRVFCHPDHAAFVTAYLDRSQLESALRAAIGKASN